VTICSDCSAQLSNDASFCSACGKAVRSSYETPLKEARPEPPSRIHIFKDGQQYGPYTSEEVRSLLSSGRLQMSDQAWVEGASGWAALSAMPEFNRMPAPPPLIVPPLSPSPAQVVFSGLPLYYQEEFGRIRASNEIYKGKWNWAAFFFTLIWALTKGVWLAPLVWFVVFWVVIIVSCGVGYLFIPLIWVLFGLRGNYMYYCASQKNQQIIV
jgi:hypothetical protein